jgi:hypothetical protein
MFPTLLFSLLLGVPAVSTAQPLTIPVPDPINENVNTLCTSAVDLGTLILPFARDEDLQNTGPAERVDFFRFTAVPGTELTVSLTGQQSGDDPYLGWFNSGCQLLAINDDSRSLDSYLALSVPDDGVLVLAATRCCDGGFLGESNFTEFSYRLSVDVLPPGIGKINLQIQNARTFEPIRGGGAPYAYADLYSCTADCDVYIGSSSANSDGRLVFDGSNFNPRLSAGTYLLRVGAEDFGSNESGRFRVSAGGDVSLVVRLKPPPISLGQQLHCENLPPQGGVCNYSVVLNNNTDRALSALMWSNVAGYGLGSPQGYTQFEATKDSTNTPNQPRAPQLIPAFSAGAEVAFSFEVPSTVPQGAQFCQSLYIGLEPFPLVNTLDEQPLFCIEKLPNRFKIVTGISMASVQEKGNERLSQKRLRSYGLAD